MKRPLAWAVALLAVVTAVRLAWAWAEPLDLAPDEAQYWDWSRRLDWSYYSKPPGIAWINALASAMFGPTAAGLHTASVLCGALTAACLGGAAHHLWRNRMTTALTVALATTAPFLALGTLFQTTDAPLLAAYGAWLACIVRALFPGPGQPGSTLGWWALSGLCLLAGCLAKYAMVYAILGLLPFALAEGQRRSQLLTAGPWLMLAIGGLSALPVLGWNATHDWIGLRHVAGLAGGNASGGFQPFSPLEFLAANLGLVGPLVALAAALAVANDRRKDERVRLLTWLAGTLLALFALKGFGQHLHANWGITALPPLILLAARGLTDQRPRLTRATLATNGGLVVVGLILGLAPAWSWFLPAKLEPRRHLVGWSELGVAVGQARKHLAEATGSQPVILVKDHNLAAALAFHVPGQPHPVALNFGRRMSHYDLTSDPADHAGAAVVWVQGGEPDDYTAHIAKHLATVGTPATVAVSRGGIHLHTWTILTGTGFTGPVAGHRQPERY